MFFSFLFTSLLNVHHRPLFHVLAISPRVISLSVVFLCTPVFVPSRPINTDDENHKKKT